MTKIDWNKVPYNLKVNGTLRNFDAVLASFDDYFYTLPATLEYNGITYREFHIWCRENHYVITETHDDYNRLLITKHKL